MPVTDNSVLRQDHETAPTYTSIGSGQAASANTNFVLAGSQSSGRRADNVTFPFGFFFSISFVDLSTSGTHLLQWVWITTPQLLTNLAMRIGSSTTNYEEHAIGASAYPTDLGGWVPFWVEVDAGVDTGSPDFQRVSQIAIACGMGDISQNLHNLVVDQCRTSVRPVLTFTGSGGTFASFVTADASNRSGCLLDVNGVLFASAPFQIGGSSTTTFTDNGKTVAFIDATWLPSASTWAGIDIDLQSPTTTIDLESNVFASANPTGVGVRKPDFMVVGLGGTVDISKCRFDGFRTIELNSQVTCNDAVITNSGVIDATNTGTAGADMAGTAVTDTAVSANASAMLWDVNEDPDTKTQGMSFVMGSTSTHAIEFGVNSPTTMTLRDCTFTGYGTVNDANDSTFHVRRTSGNVTINIIGGSGNVSVRSDGANVTVVQNPVTLQLNVADLAGSPISGARVYLIPSDNTGPIPYQDTIVYTWVAGTVSVTHSGHGLAENDQILIEGATLPQHNGIRTITNVTANAYDYAEATAPTGTLQSTGVLISDVTNASGIVSDTRTYSTDQPITGRVRKSTAAPFYRTSAVSGTISASSGLSIDVQMIPDE